MLPIECVYVHSKLYPSCICELFSECENPFLQILPEFAFMCSIHTFQTDITGYYVPLSSTLNSPQIVSAK